MQVKHAQQFTEIHSGHHVRSVNVWENLKFYVTAWLCILQLGEQLLIRLLYEMKFVHIALNWHAWKTPLCYLRVIEQHNYRFTWDSFAYLLSINENV